MPATKLTARFCEGVKPTPGKQSAYPDSLVKGLELRVSGDGRKTWSFRYRTRDGRQARVTLGVFSDAFDLEKGRREAAKARVLVDEGKDPAAVLRAAKDAAKLEPIRTFDDLAEAYFKACERGEWAPKGRKKRAVSIENDRSVYRLYIKSPLAKLRPEAIKWATVRAFLRDMVDRGITTRVNRAHALVSQILTFAVSEERIESNPVAGRRKLVSERPRARIYTDVELRAVWAGLGDPEALRVSEALAAKRRDGDRVFVGPAVCIALKLTLMLLNRRTEISGMSLDELDLENGVWLIPEERMKNHRPLAVPLSEAALSLIREALALHAGRQTRFVFPSPRYDQKPIGGAALSHALTGVRLALGIRGATVHDLRRTGSTLMTSERLGISPFIRSKVLGHTDAGGGASVSTSVYDVNSYLPEKRRALEAWQGLLLEIVGEQTKPTNVHKLRPVGT
jgi:integrase